MATTKKTIIHNPVTGTRTQERVLGSDNIVERDASGKVVYEGSSDSETRAIKAGATLRDNAPPPLTHEQQVIADYKQKQADAAAIAALTPPNLTPEQRAQIGKINPNNGLNPNDTLNQDILANIQAHNNGLNYIGTQFGNDPNNFLGKVGGATSLNTVMNILPKLTAFASKLPGGTSTVNALSQNRKLREYLKDYSNEDNLASVRKNVRTANTQIHDMIMNAKITENTPENNQVTNQIYNGAMQRKFDSIAQLKSIGNGDQRAYTDDIKDDLVELNLYFYGDPTKNVPPGKVADDYALYAALNKPSPKYLPKTGGE